MKVNKNIMGFIITASLVGNTFTSTVLAKDVEKYNNSDKKSREIYEPITKIIKNLAKTKSSTLPDTLEVNDNTLSMTANDVIQIKAVFDYKVENENLKWTFGGKDISEWKTWNSNSKDYTGDSFINIEDMNIEYVKKEVEGKEEYQSIVTATMKVGLLYNTVDLSPRSIRVLYPNMIGNYDLKLEDTSNQSGNSNFKTSMKLNVYDSYRTYDEIKPEIDEIFKKANENIYLSYESIGKSVQGRDMHFVVMAKDQDSVDDYLNEMVPMMLEKPEKLQKMVKDKSIGDYKVPIFLNNIHADEAIGVDAQLDILKMFTTQDTIKYKTLDENNEEIEVELNIDELLDNVIFVMSITENPDGRYHNTRANANGFDLNRDNGYQTQPETQSIVSQITKWNPISFLDLHGFIKGFLIEPCTPPHDPNYEYDLIAENATAQAQAMGNAAISNTKYESYEIPYLDYGVNGGWDDATAAYTATYALHHGAMAHTIEVPELNQDANDAFVNAILGATSFVLEDKDNLFIQQLEYYRRGVNGEDNKAVDKYFVNAKGEEVGRPRGENENFFPEYYVLPIDESLQKNSAEVHSTIDYLIRNGVEVNTLEKDTKVGDITYPKGSYVIDMHQAKRGYANLVLYDGINVSDFEDMYAEIVMNFPDVRGFDSYEVRVSNVFDKHIKEIDSAQKTGTKVNNKYKKYVIKNTNNDTIKAINELLENKKTVQIIDKDTKNFEEGEYIVSTKDLKEIQSKYILEVQPLNEKVKAKKLETPKVYATGNYSKFILKELGFNLVNNPNESNIIVDDIGRANKEDLKDGVDYLGIGEKSLVNLGSELIKGLEVGKTNSYHEGLLRAEYMNDGITSGYDEEEYIYSAGGTWIEEVPEDVKEIAKVSTSDDFYISGWWPENEKVKGKTMGVTTELKGNQEKTVVTLFANTLTNKAHTQGGYRLIANSIYNSIDSKVVEVSPNK